MNDEVSSSTKASVVESLKPVKGWASSVNTLTSYQNLTNNTALKANPLTQLFNSESTEGLSYQAPYEPSSFTNTSNSSSFLNNSLTLNEVTNNAPLTQVLSSNQNVRSVVDVDINKPNVNFNPSNNSYLSTISTPSTGLVDTLYANLNAGQVDTNTASRLLANRLQVNFTDAPIVSNNPFTPLIGFDT